MKIRVLCIDDDQDQCDVLAMALAHMGFDPCATISPGAALDLLANDPFDVVITDLGMEEMDGLSLCDRVLGIRPGIPIIVLTGQSSMETAVHAMRAGAYDFLTKPIEVKFLQISVERAARHRLLSVEVERLQSALGIRSSASVLAGDSPAMARVNDLIQRVGGTGAAVLIQGETGTGKELVARALHAASPRSSGPFVALNCAAIPPQLLESELFGHARGSFTDAKSARQGLFLDASGGTLFLDEIGEMPIEMQAKLLRALQEKKVRPLVRELENCIERAVALARFERLTVEDLPEKIRQYRPDRFVMTTDSAADIVPVEEMERRYILRVMKLLGGNKARAAQLLGLDRRTLYRKLDRYRTTAAPAEMVAELVTGAKTPMMVR